MLSERAHWESTSRSVLASLNNILAASDLERFISRLPRLCAPDGDVSGAQLGATSGIQSNITGDLEGAVSGAFDADAFNNEFTSTGRPLRPTTLTLSSVISVTRDSQYSSIRQTLRDDKFFDSSPDSLTAYRNPSFSSEESLTLPVPVRSSIASAPTIGTAGSSSKCDKKDQNISKINNLKLLKEKSKENKKKNEIRRRKSSVTTKEKAQLEQMQAGTLLVSKQKERLLTQFQKTYSFTSDSTVVSDSSQLDSSGPDSQKKAGELLEVPNSDSSNQESQTGARSKSLKRSSLLEVAKSLSPRSFRRKNGKSALLTDQHSLSKNDF